MQSKAVVFLDLLGFSDIASKDPSGAQHLIFDYQRILKNKFKDQTVHPELSKHAPDSCIDSFEYFLPFSDSVFITSDDIPIFLRQLAHFLRHSFQINSNQYIDPENPSDIVKRSIPSICMETGNVTQTPVSKYPVLFRGGLAYDGVQPNKICAIHNKSFINSYNLTGPAVVKAVGLEKTGKGPRIFADQDSYDNVHEDFRYSFVKIEGKEAFEFLWTAFIYDSKNSQVNIRVDFLKYFLPALNLWKAFNHLEYQIHYFEFMKLIIRGAIAHTKKYFPNETNVTVNIISEITLNHGVYDKLKGVIN